MDDIKYLRYCCPFCEQYSTLIEYKTYYKIDFRIFETNKYSRHYPVDLVTEIFICPNDYCQEIVIKSAIHRTTQDEDHRLYRTNSFMEFDIHPQFQYKTFPDYIPEQILTDYQEACKIKKLSPKASATLSRRCLQGMIRDFWKIQQSKLIDAVEVLRKSEEVRPDDIDAIDVVRKIGNIGAHMEKDINVIVDVDPEEAEMLVGLLEYLFEEWYVRREEAKRKKEEIIRMGQEKDLQKKSKDNK